jgi:drug/metabolite transporter (DMT)-like permease
MNYNKSGYIFAIAAAIIWSGFILVSRLGGISALNAFDVIAIRYLICSLLLLPIWWFKFRFNIFQAKFIYCSLIGGLGYAIFSFQGFQIASASHAAILLPGLIPLFIILLATLTNKEQQSIQKWLGITVIALGVLTLIWPLINAGNGLNLGHLYLSLGAFFWALFSVLIKRWEITPWQATVSLAMLTCLVYMPIYLLFLPKNIAIEHWQAISIQAVYQGFLATIVQMVFYVRAVQLIGPASMGAVMAIVPILSGISAIFLFQEAASTSLILGLILVSIGSIAINLKRSFLSHFKNMIH